MRLGVFSYLLWMHHEILLPRAWWWVAGRLRDQEGQVLSPSSRVTKEGCSETQVLSFLIGTVGKVGCLIPKAPSNSGIGWFSETTVGLATELHVATPMPQFPSLYHASNSYLSNLDEVLGTVLGVWNSLSHIRPISATCKIVFVFG